MKRYFLEYCKDPLQRTFFSLVEFTNIGRVEGNTICLEDPEISRRHARVALQGGQYVLYDLGSRNGTFVNGLKVQSQVLEHGDLIRLGQTTLRFLESEELGRRIALEETQMGLLQDFQVAMDDHMHVAKTLLEPLPVGVAIINEGMQVHYCNESLASFRAGGVHQGRAHLGDLLGCSRIQGESAVCGHSPGCAECPVHIAAARVFRESVPTDRATFHWQGSVSYPAAYIRFSLLPLPYSLNDESVAQLIWEDVTPARPARQERPGTTEG